MGGAESGHGDVSSHEIGGRSFRRGPSLFSRFFGRRPGRRSAAFLDLGDESVAPSVDRLDRTLAVGVVAHGATRCGDAAGQDGIAHRLSGPECIEELALGDDALPVADQVDEDVEDPGFHRDHPPSPTQLEEARIQLVVAKVPDHGREPSSPPEGGGRRLCADAAEAPIEPTGIPLALNGRLYVY